MEVLIMHQNYSKMSIVHLEIQLHKEIPILKTLSKVFKDVFIDQNRAPKTLHGIFIRVEIKL